jgi:hypothetical protein
MDAYLEQHFHTVSPVVSKGMVQFGRIVLVSSLIRRRLPMPLVENTITNNDGEVITIYIEVDKTPTIDPYTPYTDLRGEGNQVIDTAKDIFGSGMNLIHTCAEQVINTIQKVDHTMRPTEFELQLAIKLDSTVGAILAKASAEAQLQVTMKWVNKEKRQA